MATKKPRLTISLNQHLYEAIHRLSQLGGQPMATIISEMLESVHEPLMRTVAFLEAAAEAPNQVRAGLKKSFESVERDLYGSVGHSLKQMDFLIDNLKAGGATHGAAIEPAKARAPGGVPAASADDVDPHIVIRGSGSTRSGGKKSRRP